MAIRINTLADFRPQLVPRGSPEPSIRMLLEDYYKRILPNATDAEIKAGVQAYLVLVEQYGRTTNAKT